MGCAVARIPIDMWAEVGQGRVGKKANLGLWVGKIVK